MGSQITPALVRSFDGVRDAAGIYSFAGDARNTLMWSHYASVHKGVCLMFDRAQDIATLSHALRVKYVQNLPVLNWIRSFHKDISKMLSSKHPAWRYERESRIMINFQAERYLPFEPQALRGLIFGCRAEPDFIDAVEQILAERVASTLSDEIWPKLLEARRSRPRRHDGMDRVRHRVSHVLRDAECGRTRRVFR